jgi:hypothetical protein
MLNSAAAKALLDCAIAEASVQANGNYTRPRTWGVYEIEPPRGSLTRRYRLGNHPVRERELQTEFGKVKRVALFTSRALAEKLERLLNERGYVSRGLQAGEETSCARAKGGDA